MLQRFNEFAQVATRDALVHKELEGGRKTTLSFPGRRAVRAPLGPAYRPSRSVFPQSFFSRNLFAPVPLQFSTTPYLVRAGL